MHETNYSYFSYEGCTLPINLIAFMVTLLLAEKHYTWEADPSCNVFREYLSPFFYPCSKLPYRLKSRFCNSEEIVSIETLKQLHGQCSLELDTQTTCNIYFSAYWFLLRTARYHNTVGKTARSNFGSLPPVHGHLRVIVVLNFHDTEIVKISPRKNTQTDL